MDKRNLALAKSEPGDAPLMGSVNELSAERGSETGESLAAKPLAIQQQEMKRMMQSQRSLANATKSIAKLMRVHDHASNWSLVDQSRHAAVRGSANFINTRITTADPTVFRGNRSST